MQISDIIALLAFLLGVYGSVISTLLALESNLKLKLTYLNESYLTLSTNFEEYINEYGEYFSCYHKDLYTIAIYVRIVNKSNVSTTINEFILNDNYTLDSSFNMSNSLIPTSFNFLSNEISATSFESLEKNTLKPLLKLNPLSTVEGYLIFTNLKEIPTTFKISINAVQKKKLFNLKFNFSKDYRNVKLKQ